MADALASPQAISEALESVDVAMCVFDESDAALLWNRTFVKLFPEHAAHITVGEPYRANLRRFYERRLVGDEAARIDRYIDEGVARHRAQQRPYAFEHHGARLWVASLPLPGVGRIRIWKADPQGSLAIPDDGPVIPGRSEPPFDGAEWFDHVADGVMVTDREGRIVWVNEPFVLMYRLADRAAAIGVGFEDVYRAAWHGAAADDSKAFADGLATLAENLRFAGAPFELALPAARWSRVTARPGPQAKSFTVHVDITSLKRQQHQLVGAERRARQSEEQLAGKSRLLEATLERMEQGVMMVNPARIVEVCNRRAIELLGLPAELMASKPSFEAVLAYQWSTDEFRHTPADVQEFVKSGGILDRPHSYDRRRPDGRVIEVQSVPIEGGGVLRTYTDITERKKSDERIRHIARHDGLTALANRAVFLECLASAAQAYRSSADAFAVHYIDLDGFKPVNDRFGHGIGDKVLALAAARMRSIAREADVVARLGGDEFAILQYRVERIENARRLAERIGRGLREPMEIEGQSVEVGASIGIAFAAEADLDPESILRRADTALYAAKAGGRNCVRAHGDAPG